MRAFRLVGLAGLVGCRVGGSDGLEARENAGSYEARAAGLDGEPGFTLGDDWLWSLEPTDVGEHHATVWFLSDGTLAVAWTWERYSPQSKAYLRIVDSDGKPSQDAIPLGKGGSAAKPDVAVDHQGNLLVGYESLDDDTLGVDQIDPLTGGVRSFTLARGGRAAGNNSIALSVLDDDSQVALWWSTDGELGQREENWIRRRVGDTFTGPLRIGPTDEVGGAAAPDLDAVPGGRVAVAWAHLTYEPGEDPDSTLKLEVREFSGPKLVYKTSVYTGVDSFTVRPQVAVDSVGRVALVWPNLRDVTRAYPTPVSAMLACYDTDGTELLPPTLVVPEAADKPTVHFLDDDTVAIAWNEALDTSDNGVYLEIVDFPSGDVVVAPTLLSDPLVEAERPSISAIGTDVPGEWKIGVSWEEHSDLLPERDIHGRMVWYAP